jgi:hypothetical protein
MPKGKGTYGAKVGRPPVKKKKKSNNSDKMAMLRKKINK